MADQKSEQQQPQESYDIFHKLIIGPGDTVGAVAYSIFRQEEDLFIKKVREERKKKGKNPDDIVSTQALNDFARKVDNAQSIARYRADAERFIQTFQKKASDQLSEEIVKQIAKELQSKSRWDKHRDGILDSMIATLLIGLLALLAALAQFGTSWLTGIPQ